MDDKLKEQVMLHNKQMLELASKQFSKKDLFMGICISFDSSGNPNILFAEGIDKSKDLLKSLSQIFKILSNNVDNKTSDKKSSIDIN